MEISLKNPSWWWMRFAKKLKCLLISQAITRISTKSPMSIWWTIKVNSKYFLKLITGSSPKTKETDLKDDITYLSSLASSAVKLSLSLESDCIVVLSDNDALPRFISNLRPESYIVFPNQNESMLRKLTLNFGVVTTLINASENGNESLDLLINRWMSLREILGGSKECD